MRAIMEVSFSESVETEQKLRVAFGRYPDGTVLDEDFERREVFYVYETTAAAVADMPLAAQFEGISVEVAPQNTLFLKRLVDAGFDEQMIAIVLNTLDTVCPVCHDADVGCKCFEETLRTVIVTARSRTDLDADIFEAARVLPKESAMEYGQRAHAWECATDDEAYDLQMRLAALKGVKVSVYSGYKSQ